MTKLTRLSTARLRSLALGVLVAAPMALALAGPVGPGGAAAVAAAPADRPGARVVSLRLREAVRTLPVRAETPRGYDRDKYRHWIDADGDCRDTRDEVLAAESTTAVTGCDVRTGRWRSYYDRKTWTRSSDVDVDHLVPLKESWDSGGRRWNAATRTRYANDLADRRTLVAVTDNVNQSKSDRDPADWMPAYGKCRYIRQWAAIKLRWRLSVDRAERRKLVKVADGCPNVVLRVSRAKVVTSGSSGTAGGGGGGGLDPRFDYCYQAKAAGYGPYRQGSDPEYAWYTDSDSDGVVCE